MNPKSSREESETRQLGNTKVLHALSQSHSGAALNLMKHKDSIVVSKRMPLNERSLKCLSKQKNFEPFGSVHAVEIIDQIVEENEVVVLMPLIRGVVGVDYIKSMTVGDVSHFSRSLRSLIKRHFRLAQRVAFDQSPLVNKIDQLLADPQVNELYSSVLRHCKTQLWQIESFPKGPCHGDLTLGNIIFVPSSGNSFLIDFLDVFLETPLIDIAKLEQDLVHGWSSRYERAEVKVRSKIFGSHIFSEMAPVEKQDERLYGILSTINTIRILPYCRDEITREWIKEVVKIQKEFL